MANLRKRLTQNWPSGLSVALVSIPLSVSLAVASQAQPVVGIITAIWAGLIAAISGGSNYNIIGPTGALSGILAMYAIAHGAETLPTVAIVSGLLILLAHRLHFEKYLIFVPASTVHGFTLGVAGIIILSQLNSALGLNNLPLHAHLIANTRETLLHLTQFSGLTFTIFLSSLSFLLITTKLAPKIPGVIFLTPIGIGLGYLTTANYLPYTLPTLQTKFGTITPSLGLKIHFSWDPQIISVSLVVAFIALLETMISARIADSLTKTKHHRRQEIIGLGLANLASGIMGGIPATAALARTALNIKAGATNKTSAIISSIGIALISLLFLSWFKFMPLAVIAAILVYIALRMIDLHHFQRLYSLDRPSFYVALFAAVITIYLDPTMGILCGITLASFTVLDKLSQGHFELITGHKDHFDVPENTLIYSFKGQLVYINTEAHLARFENLQPYQTIILRLRTVFFIDVDGLEALDQIISLIQAKGENVLITEACNSILPALQDSPHFVALQKQGLVFPSITAALNYLHSQTPKSIKELT